MGAFIMARTGMLYDRIKERRVRSFTLLAFSASCLKEAGLRSERILLDDPATDMDRLIVDTFELPPYEIRKYVTWLESARQKRFIELKRLFACAFYDHRFGFSPEENRFGKIHIGFFLCHDIIGASVGLQLLINEKRLLPYPDIACGITEIPHHIIVPEGKTPTKHDRHQSERSMPRQYLHLVGEHGGIK